DELWIIQAKAKTLRGLETSPSVTTLKLSYCRALEGLSGLPKSLVKLTLEKCLRLKDLSFLAKHPSLEFLYAEIIDSVAFAPTLRRLEYFGSRNIVDGDLKPLVASKSLRKVGLADRKNYTPKVKELNELLAAR